MDNRSQNSHQKAAGKQQALAQQKHQVFTNLFK